MMSLIKAGCNAYIRDNDSKSAQKGGCFALFTECNQPNKNKEGTHSLTHLLTHSPNHLLTHSGKLAIDYLKEKHPDNVKEVQVIHLFHLLLIYSLTHSFTNLLYL